MILLQYAHVILSVDALLLHCRHLSITNNIHKIILYISQNYII